MTGFDGNRRMGFSWNLVIKQLKDSCPEIEFWNVGHGDAISTRNMSNDGQSNWIEFSCHGLSGPWNISHRYHTRNFSNCCQEIVVIYVWNLFVECTFWFRKYFPQVVSDGVVGIGEVVLRNAQFRLMTIICFEMELCGISNLLDSWWRRF